MVFEVFWVSFVLGIEFFQFEARLMFEIKLV